MRYTISIMTKQRILILIATLGYIAAFSAYYLRAGNYEFLWYISVMLGFVILVASTINRTQFSSKLLLALSLWGFMHMSGGGIQIDGHVLYAEVLLPIIVSGEMTILKFDQFVHFYGFAVATVAMYHLLKPLVSNGLSRGRVLFLVFLAGMGLGALNEVVEFIATLALPSTNVGGYINTGLDLISNLLGALFATVLIFWFERKNDRVG